MNETILKNKLFEIFDKKFIMMWKKHPQCQISRCDSADFDELTKDWHLYVCSLGAHLTKNYNLPLKCCSQSVCGCKTVHTPDPATMRGKDDIDYIVLDSELSKKIITLFELP